MVDIALTILSGEKSEKSYHARKFAIKTLATFSGVKVADSDVEDWAKSGDLPKGDFTNPTSDSSSCPRPSNLDSFTEEENKLALARVIFGEARGELVEAQMAVGHVVLNRLQSGRFAKNIAGVIYQHRQFSSMNSGDPSCLIAHSIDFFEDNNKIAASIYKISSDLMDRKLSDNTKNATFFYNGHISSPKWSKNKIPTFQSGNLIFFSDN